MSKRESERRREREREILIGEKQGNRERGEEEKERVRGG